jgi:hypothetical protein
MSAVRSFVTTVQSQSENAVVTGFSFAAAIAWIDVVRWVIANVIKVNKTSGAFTTLAALLTTMLAVAVYLALKFLDPVNVREPQQPVYAVVG